VALLLRERSGREVDAVTVRTVAERTGGNPLFVCETARLITTDGTSAARALPPGVRDLIRRRIARLPATAQRVLRDAAVVGRDVDVDVLLTLEGAEEDAALEALEAGVVTGLLTEPAPGRVRFAHVLVRETLYEDTPVLRRTRLHGKVVGALERVRPGEVTALGHHALAAATPASAGRAVPYARAAAEQARGMHSYREAGVFYRGASIQPGRHVDQSLVDALVEALDGADDETRCRLLATLVFELEGHDDERCRAYSAEAVEIARRLGRTDLVCLALNARYFVLLTPDRRDELEVVARELVELGDRAGLPGYAMQGHHALFMVSLGRCDLAAARHHADRALEHSTAGQLGLALGVLSMLDTLILLIKGDFEGAERSYLAIADRMMAAGGANAHIVGPIGRFAARLAGGLPQDIPELLALYELVPEGVSDILVRALVAAGRVAEARTYWQPDQEPRLDYYWLLWQGLRGENAIALGDRRAAEHSYEVLLPWDGEPAGMHSGSITLGPVAQILGDLAVFLGRDATAHYERAVAVAERIGSPHWARRSTSAPADRSRTGQSTLSSIVWWWWMPRFSVVMKSAMARARGRSADCRPSASWVASVARRRTSPRIARWVIWNPRSSGVMSRAPRSVRAAYPATMPPPSYGPLGGHLVVSRGLSARSFPPRSQAGFEGVGGVHRGERTVVRVGLY